MHPKPNPDPPLRNTPANDPPDATLAPDADIAAEVSARVRKALASGVWCARRPRPANDGSA